MLRQAVPSGREKRAILHLLRTIKSQRKLDIPEDTTEYLMRGINGKKLMEAIRDIEEGRNIVYHDLIEV
ncbi:hypothetical protein [Dyadobacter luticola]|uniref:Uncharacterized protein n=1 Tax=Dyadobacter luticola TaxID=1979387 RepID=A0A5R9KTC0_9BACT|nr:hypothetical protein [Dyadobacter luticola]TLU99326.1 hypothetical protein FEN17_22440 [Dyadobacter luticola]